jgi:hypothetical protein
MNAAEATRELAEESLRGLQDESVTLEQMQMELQGQLERVMTELKDKRERGDGEDEAVSCSLIAGSSKRQQQGTNGAGGGVEAARITAEGGCECSSDAGGEVEGLQRKMATMKESARAHAQARIKQMQETAQSSYAELAAKVERRGGKLEWLRRELDRTDWAKMEAVRNPWIKRQRNGTERRGSWMRRYWH